MPCGHKAATSSGGTSTGWRNSNPPTSVAPLFRKDFSKWLVGSIAIRIRHTKGDLSVVNAHFYNNIFLSHEKIITEPEVSIR